MDAREVRIPVGGGASVGAALSVPAGAVGVVAFAHGSGSSRHSRRNAFVADILLEARLATLLLDLLTPAEETVDQRTAEFRFDIDLLASRLVDATHWTAAATPLRDLPLGYFGASTGAAAALVAAARLPAEVRAVVSRGGRPDLAGASLASVRAPTLLIVGGADVQVLDLNRRALAHLNAASELTIIPGASHLFEEPGALEAAARKARDWFARFLTV